MRLRGEVNALKKLTSANTSTNSKGSSTAITSFSGAAYAPVAAADTEHDQFGELDDIEAGKLVQTVSSAHSYSEVRSHWHSHTWHTRVPQLLRALLVVVDACAALSAAAPLALTLVRVLHCEVGVHAVAELKHLRF
jgi:hypothetical protein